MKNLILLSILFVSCNRNEPSIVGDWKVDSKFYQATCRIEKEGKYFDGLALSYNDGTTFYKYKEGQPRYFFKNLRKKDTFFVDGISGATDSNAEDQSHISLHFVTRDTLKVITKISNKLIEEIWVRK